jgi:hypothetical protein
MLSTAIENCEREHVEKMMFSREYGSCERECDGCENYDGSENECDARECDELGRVSV